MLKFNNFPSHYNIKCCVASLAGGTRTTYNVSHITQLKTIQRSAVLRFRGAFFATIRKLMTKKRSSKLMEALNRPRGVLPKIQRSWSDCTTRTKVKTALITMYIKSEFF